MSGKTIYRFSFGPWNLHPGADPFGPEVRSELTVAQKLRMMKELGFDYAQFHDDDVVPDADASWPTIEREAKKVRRILEGEGLKAEFVAPRLWFHARTRDGAFTSNLPADRKYAIERAKRS